MYIFTHDEALQSSSLIESQKHTQMCSLLCNELEFTNRKVGTRLTVEFIFYRVPFSVPLLLVIVYALCSVSIPH